LALRRRRADKADTAEMADKAPADGLS